MDDDLDSMSGSGSASDQMMIIGISAGASLVALCFCIAFVSCCIAGICWKYFRKKKQQTMILQELPSFRIIDAPNAVFYDHHNDEDSDFATKRSEVMPLTNRQNSDIPSVAASSTAADYSYATPNELRFMTPSGVRTAAVEDAAAEYTYAKSVGAPLHSNDKQRPISDPIPSPDRAISPYSEPISPTIGQYGSFNNSPPQESRVAITLSSPPDISPHYMVPETDEEALYAQIKSLSVKQINRENINTKEELGNGNFGLVYKGIWKNHNGSLKPIAIKTLKTESCSTFSIIKFLQEAAIMGQFHHPNIVKLHGVVTVGEPIMIVLELMELGDLRKFLSSLISNNSTDKSSLPSLLLNFCQQIASGMNYLSSKCFVHRDLAARNILLNHKHICKIGDFGLARDLVDEDYYISRGGKIPVKWTAPEALDYRKYSSASDVWSYGVLLFEIWGLGRKPFDQQTNQQCLRLVESGYRLPPPPGCPRGIYEIMIQCWNPEYTRRPTFIELEMALAEDETSLLEWTDKDLNIHPDASTLGADLSSSENLYTDLQITYKLN